MGSKMTSLQIMVFLGFSLLGLSTNAQRNLNDLPVMDPILNGQCQGILSSKEYINYKPGALVRFTCDYKCLDNDGVPHIVNAESQAYADGGQSEMYKMVCSGAIVGKVGSSFTVTNVKSFWAKLSPLPEIRKWQRAFGVRLGADFEAALKLKMLQDFKMQSDAYLKPALPGYFNEAGKTLKFFSEDSLESRQLLAEWVERIDNGFRPTQGKDQIIWGSIVGSARHLLRDAGI